MNKKINTNENEKKVLSYLYQLDTYNYIYFDRISRQTSMPRNKVRLACRSLARKGLAERKPVGAGWYAITEKGVDYQLELGHEKIIEKRGKNRPRPYLPTL